MDIHENQYRCSRCGTDVREGERYCRICGNPLERNKIPAANPPIAPMNLGDIFNRLVHFIGRSFFRYMAVAAVIFIPAAMIIIIGTTEFYASLDLSPGYYEDDIEEYPLAAEDFRAMGIMGFAALFTLIAYLAGTIAVTSIVHHEFHNSRINWRNALTHSFSMFLLRALGLVLVLAFIFGGAFFIFAVFIGITGAILDTFFIAIPLFLAVFIIMMYVYFRLAFALPAIVCENAGVFQGLSRSWALVKGNWWRVFGIMILLGIMAEFAMTIITTPIALLAMWPVYRALFGAMGDGIDETEIMAVSFESMGIGFGIIVSVQLVLTAFITPIYTTILYYDLRARRGEFIPRQPDSSSGGGEPAQPA